MEKSGFFYSIYNKKQLIIMYINYYKKFEEDLKINSIYEEYVAKLFEEKGFELIEFCNNKFFDIKMKNRRNKIRLIEVKKDNQTDTGNIIFEYQSYGKDSGIRTTKAHYWVYVFPLLNEVWILSVKKLRKLIEFYNPTERLIGLDNWTWVYGGDGKNTKCYLWNRETFKNIVGTNDLIILKRKDIPNE